MPRKTYVYATHGIPLECDVYTNGDEPLSNPVVLFFHAGGLVGGSRTRIPPWLVQICIQRQWALISASYRLVPQVDGSDLLEDARAAYSFAQSWPDNARRKVVVAGASAGFFVATLVAHHLQPAPVALLSITGISTFQHSFYNSSTLVPPRPFVKTEMEKVLDRPVSVGFQPESDSVVFSPAMLTSTGARNPSYVRPMPQSSVVSKEDVLRGSLYHYLLSENAFPPLVRAVDPDFTWAIQESGRQKLKSWPKMIFIHGDADKDVDLAVTVHAAECLGSEKAKLYIAKGQPHLFEATNFIEDEGDAMDTVRSAVHELDSVVAAALT